MAQLNSYAIVLWRKIDSNVIPFLQRINQISDSHDIAYFQDEPGNSFTSVPYSLNIKIFPTALAIFLFALSRLYSNKAANDKFLFVFGFHWPHYLVTAYIGKYLLGYTTILVADTTSTGHIRKLLAVLLGTCVINPAFDHALAASISTADYFLKVGISRAKIKVGYMDVNTGTTDSLKLNQSLSTGHLHVRPLIMNASSPRFLYVGRLSKEKNVDLLLSAWLRLMNKGLVDRRQLIIAGEGPLKERLDLSICDYRGYLTPSDLINCYKEADCLILPSSFEPFGAVVAEAASCGLFLILSPQVNARYHFLVPNANGVLICTPITEDTIAASMEDCLAMSPYSIRERGVVSLTQYAVYHEHTVQNINSIFTGIRPLGIG